MALQKQNVPIDFGGGLDTKTDPKQAIPGSFTTLENAVRKKGKAFAKRYGYGVLGSPIGASSGRAVASFKNELLKFENHKAYAYSTKMDDWVSRGTAIPCHVDTQSIVRNSYGQSSPDSATVGNITVYAYVEDGDVKATVYDEQSQAIILAGTTIGTGDSPRVIVMGTTFAIFYTTAAGAIHYETIVASSPSVVVFGGDVAVDLNTSSPRYDVDTNGTFAVVAYNSTTASTTKLIKLDSTLTSVATDSIASASTLCVSVNIGPSGRIWILYASVGAFKAHAAESDLTTHLFTNASIDSSSTVVKAIGYEPTGTGASLTIVYEITSDTNDHLWSASITAAGSTAGGSLWLSSFGLATRPFYYTLEGNSRAYFGIYNYSTTQSTLFVVRYDKAVVAKFAVGLAGNQSNSRFAQRVTSLGNGQYTFCYLRQDQTLSSQFAFVYSINSISKVTLDLEPDYAFVSAEVGDNLIVANGVVSLYDGTSYVEHGFHLYPELSAGSSANSTGHLSPSTTNPAKTVIYSYVATFEWTDAQGRVHRSAPSPLALSITMGTSDNTTQLTCTNLMLTAKANVLVVIWRTEGSGTVYYRVTSINPADASQPAIINNVSTGTFTYIDTLADSDLIKREILYTTGGILENIAPPAAKHVAEYKNRAILTGVEGSDTAWYSKAADGTSAAAFTDLFTIAVVGKGGKILASGRIDDKLILLKSDTAFGLYGDGPNDAGVGSFTEPEPINLDTGVADPASVVTIPAGLAFKSEKGLYLIGRDLSPQYFGAAVEEWNGETITGAALHKDVNQVRFVTAAGPCLVFDYLYNQWSTFTNHEAQGCAVWDSRFILVKSDGNVYKEDYSVFQDDGTAYYPKVVLGWLSFAGLQGVQRIYRVIFLGELKSAHTLEIKVGYDFKDAFDSTITFDSSALQAGEAYQIRSHLSKQKCEAIRFQITETTDAASAGEALTMSAITLEVGAKRGLKKLRSGLTATAT